MVSLGRPSRRGGSSLDQVHLPLFTHTLVLRPRAEALL